MSYGQELGILFLFFTLGAVIYIVFAEYSSILYKERAHPFMKDYDLGLDYFISTRIMFFGLFIGGVSGMLLSQKVSKMNVT